MSKQNFPLAPFILTFIAISLDQITKALVVGNLAQGATGFTLFGDYFWLVHVRNKGGIFSLGQNFGEVSRIIILIALPILMICLSIIYFFKGKHISPIMRWALCGIAGGGIGNLIDRIFRTEGVVDFLSFKFIGLFGWNRFPTFNVADSFVVVCVIILFIATIVNENKISSASNSLETTPEVSPDKK